MTSVSFLPKDGTWAHSLSQALDPKGFTRDDGGKAVVRTSTVAQSQRQKRLAEALGGVQVGVDDGEEGDEWDAETEAEASTREDMRLEKQLREDLRRVDFTIRLFYDSNSHGASDLLKRTRNSEQRDAFLSAIRTRAIDALERRRKKFRRAQLMPLREDLVNELKAIRGLGGLTRQAKNKLFQSRKKWYGRLLDVRMEDHRLQHCQLAVELKKQGEILKEQLMSSPLRTVEDFGELSGGDDVLPPMHDTLGRLGSETVIADGDVDRRQLRNLPSFRTAANNTAKSTPMREAQGSAMLLTPSSGAAVVTQRREMSTLKPPGRSEEAVMGLGSSKPRPAPSFVAPPLPSEAPTPAAALGKHVARSARLSSNMSTVMLSTPVLSKLPAPPKIPEDDEEPLDMSSPVAMTPRPPLTERKTRRVRKVMAAAPPASARPTLVANSPRPAALKPDSFSMEPKSSVGFGV